MLDIQFIRDNAELVQEKSQQKGYQVDISKLITLDTKRRDALAIVEELRQKRNELSDRLKTSNGQPNQADIDTGKQIKIELVEKEEVFEQADDEYQKLLRQIPNVALNIVPTGSSEDDNVVTKEVGDKPTFDFKAYPHWEISCASDLFDKERAAKIAGSRFVYLKGGLVRLQLAIMQYVMETLGNSEVIKQLVDKNGLQLSSKPFTPVLPPALLRTEPYTASARLNAAEVTYKLEDDDLWLNASAEHTLCTMYWNEILPEEIFPIRYIGYSTSFRREAGTYGKDTEGIIRLHQFDKLEMEVFSTPETGLDEHKLMIAIQEYLVQQLKLPYRYLQKCTYDIGKPNASGIDLECWFPGQNRFIETHTADYMTDYQARDLKIRIKRQKGTTDFVHTNDATAFALSRILAAIMENYQREDGSIGIPDVLIPYVGGLTEIR